MDEFRSEQRITLTSGVTPIAYGRPPSAHPPPSAPPSRPRRRAPPPGNPVQWMPPTPEEAARARAQIGSEVLQWHARRSSRSISIDESSSAATSEPQSPTADLGEPIYYSPLYGDQNFEVISSPTSPEPQQPQTMTSSTVLVLKSPYAP